MSRHQTLDHYAGHYGEAGRPGVGLRGDGKDFAETPGFSHSVSTAGHAKIARSGSAAAGCGKSNAMRGYAPSRNVKPSTDASQLLQSGMEVLVPGPKTPVITADRSELVDAVVERRRLQGRLMAVWPEISALICAPHRWLYIWIPVYEPATQLPAYRRLRNIIVFNALRNVLIRLVGRAPLRTESNGMLMPAGRSSGLQRHRFAGVVKNFRQYGKFLLQVAVAMRSPLGNNPTAKPLDDLRCCGTTHSPTWAWRDQDITLTFRIEPELKEA